MEVIKKEKFISKSAGEFNAVIYSNKLDGIEHIALVKGEISQNSPTLVRMHHLNILSDCLDDASNSRANLLQKALKKIAKEKNGVIVLIRQPNETISHLLGEQNQTPNKEKELRNYGIGAQILADLGIKNMTLLANAKKSVIGLEAYDIKICGYKKL